MPSGRMSIPSPVPGPLGTMARRPFSSAITAAMPSTANTRWAVAGRRGGAESAALVPALELSGEQRDQFLCEKLRESWQTPVPAIMTRDVLNGRPYIRVRPNTAYVLGEAFDSVDRLNDTRYNKTFQTVFIANTSGISNTAGAANNSRGIGYTMNVGVDTAVWFPPYEVPGAPQFNGATPFNGIIVPPSLQTNAYFPANRKFDDPSRPAADFNDPSTRPVILWRFSDVYCCSPKPISRTGSHGCGRDDQCDQGKGSVQPGQQLCRTRRRLRWISRRAR